MSLHPTTTHTILGQHLFKFCAWWTKYILKHKKLFYILSFTWGGVMSIFGLVCYICLQFVTFFCPWVSIFIFDRYFWLRQVSFGRKSWGGIAFGPVFLRDTNYNSYTARREFGYALLNCLLGPIFIVIVLIPRFLIYFINLTRQHKILPWFEDIAIQSGKYAEWFL